MQSVLFTHVFERQAKRAGVTEQELEDICSFLSQNPMAGDLIVGTGGARKIRFAGREKGKSGGYRTIHFFGGDDVPIFALALISKGERSDLSQAERNELARTLPTIAEIYRRDVRLRSKEKKR